MGQRKGAASVTTVVLEAALFWGQSMGGRSSGSAAESLARGVERLVGSGAQRGNGDEAHHHDEGQHDGIFDCGRAVFPRDEIPNELTQLAHVLCPFGSLAVRPASRQDGSMALRPRLTTGLPFRGTALAFALNAGRGATGEP